MLIFYIHRVVFLLNLSQHHKWLRLGWKYLWKWLRTWMKLLILRAYCQNWCLTFSNSIHYVQVGQELSIQLLTFNEVRAYGKAVMSRSSHELSRVAGKLSPSLIWLIAMGHNHFSILGPSIWKERFHHYPKTHKIQTFSTWVNSSM